MRVRSRDLPDFPWDSLAGAKARALAHPDGIVDLSVGTPVDPTPELGRRALIEAANAPGYPTVWGTSTLRSSIRRYLATRWDAVPVADEGVLPVIGTKELVAALPHLLGLGPDDIVVIPRVAYPTYEVGGRLAGARVVACDDPDEIEALSPALVWINSPANPHGEILSRQRLAGWVNYCRARGSVLASDECYGEFGWEAEPVSVLHRSVNGGALEGLLAVHSLSKRSNLAGYRAGFVAGEAEMVSDLRELRKHAGGIVPAPVQAAMAALLDDQSHVVEQRGRYLARRAVLRPALEAAGFRVEHSEGSLYLWCTRDEDGRASVDWLADRGILVAPGDFYGAASARHVRVALTATDERIASGAARLAR
ncbi:succinyldiaminopimelate transaminase [Micropruina sonneratiae]|uniref:succinyldiaminopimelate transaminase n=1 Tax=Micropruina sonneratiae TaxID=2986940 RepID=UPI002226ADF6|nr:succinyldiaminopimelate transaminase [Micropruina sp. KQZ13P-5]MCW3156742.1 succinyldiaminopimelate transaminase [Micropruina sp. KQZ13P-5]